VIAFGFFDTPLQHLQADPTLREQQQARFERMAPYVASTALDGIYEVVEEVTPQ